MVGIISAFNFPVAVWAWNSFLAAICGDICLWKPSNKTPLTAIASLKICNEALKAGGFPDIFLWSTMPAPHWPRSSSKTGASR